MPVAAADEVDVDDVAAAAAAARTVSRLDTVANRGWSRPTPFAQEQDAGTGRFPYHSGSGPLAGSGTRWCLEMLLPGKRTERLPESPRQ